MKQPLSKRWSKIAKEWFLDASVLIIVFGLLDAYIKDGKFKIGYVIGIASLSILCFMACLYFDQFVEEE